MPQLRNKSEAGCDGGGGPVPGVSAVVIAVGYEFVGRLRNLLLRHRVSARASRRALACPISQSGLAKVSLSRVCHPRTSPVSG
jgi:hypothetical protein